MPHRETQKSLFGTERSSPSGFVYRSDFITEEEEVDLASYFSDLPFEASSVRGYEAKRRAISFGWRYSRKTDTLIPGPPLPPFLHLYQRKIAKWLGISKEHVVEALITEYAPGAHIGWHRDNETFETIIGISLLGPCRFRLRPLRKSREEDRRSGKDIFSLWAEPRSVYVMQKTARWKYQHSITPVEALRYSITFRTLPKEYVSRVYHYANPIPPIIAPIPKREMR